MVASITRKAFIGTGALAAAALATVSAAAMADEAGETAAPAVQVPAWLGTEPEDPTEFAQELECDVALLAAWALPV